MTISQGKGSSVGLPRMVGVTRPKRKTKKAAAKLPEADSPDRWKAEDDLRTLTRARDIKKDPQRLKAAKAVATEQRDALNGIADED